MYVEAIKKEQNPLVEYMSEPVRRILGMLDFGDVQEIRLRRNKPLSIHFFDGYMFAGKNGVLTRDGGRAYIVSGNDIERCMELLCRGSVYSYQDEICAGYITVGGGHRVGICGKAVMKDGMLTFIKDVSGLNFRYAREIVGVADGVMKHIDAGGMVKNTLIVSAPSQGKTTMLRDIARALSCRGHKILIADERSEIAAVSDGICGYDVGMLTDVLDACPKAMAILMAVRSMSPEVIISDEIGSEADFAALYDAARCGVSVVASIHASSASRLFENEKYRHRLGMFDVFVTLSQRRVESVQTYDELMKSEVGGGD